VASYAAEHASALADIRAAGADVTFSVDLPGTYDAATGTYSGASTVTVTGAAVRVPGNPETYRRLSLTEGEAPTLLFAPNTYGSMPTLPMRVTWDSVDYTVRDISPTGPSGPPWLARVVVAR
jgi:hypothetical protein